jgi:PAS domain S-box-containing protein
VNATGYAFLGLTALVAVLVAVLAFAVLRFFAAARDAGRNALGRSESTLVASTLEDAIGKLKAQERATAARAEASDRLRGEIVASLTSGLIVVDGTGRVQLINPAAKRILQLDDDDAVPEDTLFRDYPTLGEVIEESLRTKQAIVRRTISVERPGGTMPLGVTVSPLAAAGSAGVICLFTDLTSVIALEDQLRLKEALARLGELTAGLAHEFRNGLATIHGYARLLDPALLPAPQRPYLDGLREETQSLGQVVNNFLNFAKPEPLTLTPVDLGVLVPRAAEDFPTVRFTFDGEFPVVDGDEVLLKQAFSNVFRNSVEVCEAAKIEPEIGVTGTIDQGQRMVLLTITDNGPGIRADALPRLFQPFFTLRPGGTGLGLAIVQKVIVSHNGRITAANRPNGGALFQIGLPARPAPG